MKNALLTKFTALIAITFIFVLANAVYAQTTAFTFQGKLSDGAVAANGTYQFQFKLYDALSGGNQIGNAVADLPATVTGGIFAVNLDFGAAAFNGATRYLEIGVRLNGSNQPYTILDPRQAIASTPYAVKSLKANEATTAESAASFTGSLSGDVSGTQNATVINSVGGQSAANVAITVDAFGASTSASTPNTLVRRDGNGNFSGGTISGSGAGLTGVVKVFPFAGKIADSIPSNAAYVFVGPTTSVPIAAGQQITGAASAVLGKSPVNSQGPSSVRVGLCYQPFAGGVLTIFVGSQFAIVEIDTLRRAVAESASIGNLPAGTYKVGFCMWNNSGVAIDRNDYVNGWVMVTNN